MVAAVADVGWGVIVDHVLLDEHWVADAAATLGRFPLLAVAVRCPLAELQRRERDRGDRTVGQARAHFDTVHRWARHDRSSTRIRQVRSAGQQHQLGTADAAREDFGLRERVPRGPDTDRPVWITRMGDW